MNLIPDGVPDKDKWINQERLRWASLFNIPISKTTPVGFPHSTLKIQRALCVLPFLFPEKKAEQEVLCKLLDNFYQLYWAEGKDITVAGVLEGILRDVIGEEKAGIVLREIPGKGKEAIGRNNGRAIQEGAFGLPVSAFYFLLFFCTSHHQSDLDVEKLSDFQCCLNVQANFLLHVD